MTREQAIAKAAEISAEPLKSAPKAGSFGELCTLYLGSKSFLRTAARTQGEYRDHIDVLRAAWEDVPLVGITRKAATVLHQAFADRPWRGNAILRTLRLVLNYGKNELELPELARNPLHAFPLFDTRPRDTLWPQLHIDAFLAAASALRMPRMRKAAALLLYSVQRVSDVLKMSTPMVWETEKRTWIRLRQAKTGELLDVPCHERLAAELRAPEPVPQDKRKRLPTVLLLPSPLGLPWKRRNFSRAWDRVKARANLRIVRAAMEARGGLPPPSAPKQRAAAKAAIRAGLIDEQRRDLRRTGVVQMAIAGATTPQIAAVAGWRIDYTQAIVDTYLPKRGEVAVVGVELWEKAPPATVVRFAPRRR